MNYKCVFKKKEKKKDFIHCIKRQSWVLLGSPINYPLGTNFQCFGHSSMDCIDTVR